MKRRGDTAALFMASESFAAAIDGDIVSVKKGDLVRAGHPLLRQCKDRFKPAVGYVRFDIEQATQAPGEHR